MRLALIGYLLIALSMMFLETSLVYPIPRLSRGDWQPSSFRFEDVRFKSADGTRLHGWFVPFPGSNRAILYCHGNGEDVSSVGELAALLGTALQASVFVFDYRGYGHSEGSPNETGCIADGTAAQHWLADKVGIKLDDVIVMGRSLGGGVAVALAAENGAQALVIESTFPTMPDVAAVHYPWLPVHWIMANRYDNLARIRRYTGPLFQSHGTHDEIIPLSLGRRLFNTSPSQKKRWVEFVGHFHNSPPPPQYYVELSTFLNGKRLNLLPKAR